MAKAITVGMRGKVLLGFKDYFLNNGMGWSYENSLIKVGDMVVVNSVSEDGLTLSVSKGNVGALLPAEFFGTN